MAIQKMGFWKMRRLLCRHLLCKIRGQFAGPGGPKGEITLKGNLIFQEILLQTFLFFKASGYVLLDKSLVPPLSYVEAAFANIARLHGSFFRALKGRDNRMEWGLLFIETYKKQYSFGNLYFRLLFQPLNSFFNGLLENSMLVLFNRAFGLTPDNLRTVLGRRFPLLICMAKGMLDSSIKYDDGF